MHIKIKNHFKKADPKLFKVIEKIEDRLEGISPILPQEYFLRLCRAIIAQQLGNKISRKFLERFIKLFPSDAVSPEALLKFPDETIRGIGISWSKVKYLKDLAIKIKSKEISLEGLEKLKDEEVIIHLTKVKGIGIWTTEMFLMFALGRPDIFSHGDLGLKRAIERIYNIKNPKKEIVEKLSQKWSPYRTWASRILWLSHDIKE